MLLVHCLVCECSAYLYTDLIYISLQNTMSLGEHNELLDKIKAQVRVFKSNSDVTIYEELRNLKQYLHCRIEQREYNDKVAAAKVSFEDFRRNHVEDALRKFDRVEKHKEEESKWKWFPVYQILRKWPLRNFRDGPWDHTETEWQDMCDVPLKNTNSEPLSLEYECLHILRAILYLVRTLEGYSRPLPHPEKGLHGEYIL
jgi:hypothetical protein